LSQEGLVTAVVPCTFGAWRVGIEVCDPSSRSRVVSSTIELSVWPAVPQLQSAGLLLCLSTGFAAGFPPGKSSLTEDWDGFGFAPAKSRPWGDRAAPRIGRLRAMPIENVDSVKWDFIGTQSMKLASDILCA
jgi:hypothetical protein